MGIFQEFIFKDVMCLDIVYLNNSNSELWDSFCDKNNYSTFFYTTNALKYFCKCSFDIDTYCKCFFVIDNNEILACMPLFVEQLKAVDNGNITTLSCGGGPMLAPLIEESIGKEHRKRILKFVMSEIDNLAYSNGAVKSDIKIPVLSHEYINKLDKWNYLSQYGYTEKNKITCILDIGMGEQEIFKGCSKGHKSAIKIGLNNLELDIYDYVNIKENVVDEFKEYYFRIAGKVTRPDWTFKCIYYFIKTNAAVLYRAKYNGKVCGYMLVSIYKNTAYYYMSCKDYELSKLNISHFLQWQSIKDLKSRGIIYYEMGDQQFVSNIYEEVTEKSFNISEYKRGFGGFFLNEFCGEKFYNNEFKKKIYTNRLNNYLQGDGNER